jgi:hypothetical protein
MDMYLRLMKANLWVRDFLPNIYEELAAAPLAEKQGSIKYIQGILEYPFRGRLGDHFERWEMNRKIERFSRQAGFGEETIFNASICQGNFDHHRRWTHQEIVKRQVASSEGVNGGRMRL